MKGNKAITALMAFGVGSLLALGACGCMITAFDMTIPEFSRLVMLWCVGAAACALALSWKRGGFVVLAAAVCAGVWFWQQEAFSQQLWQMVYRISHYYNRVYRWGVFKLVETPWDAGTAELPMAALGLMLAAAGAWTVSRGQGALLTIDLTVLPLLSCVVVTDTVPAEESLYLLFLGLVLLILTSQFQKEDIHQGSRLALLAVVPTALFLGILFWAVPKETYVNRTGEIQDRILSWFDAPQTRTGPAPTVQDRPAPEKEPPKVDLAALGRRQESRQEVFQVTAETGGVLYLRGQDYDLYDGAGWHSSPNRVEAFQGAGKNLGYLVLESRREQPFLYLPYYPRDGLSLIGGAYENTRLARSYSFVRTDLPDNWRALAAEKEAETLPFLPASSSQERYLSLPEETAAGARAHLQPLLLDNIATAEKARAIAEYVRGIAAYDPNTRQMPEGAGDFALWFLEQGETGYCVHYATAAAVLLRAAGIPARYVSGYMVPAEPGRPVAVTGEYAHAWVEYYEPGLKTWVILEATPAEGIPAGETLSPTVPQETAVTEAAAEPADTAPPVRETEPVTEPPFPETDPPQTLPQTLVETEDAGKGWGWLWLAGLAVFAILQRNLRLSLGRWDRRRGAANRQALRRWREAERLAGHRKQQPPKALEALALKAKFSQHTLTEDELAEFDRYFEEARKALKESPWYWKLVYRYIFALY